MIKIGNSNIGGVSLGNTQFSKIYNGDDLVWNKRVITFINLDCNGEWQENTYSGTTINGYSVYESIYNHNVNNGKAKMIIYIDGNLTNKFSFKYRSDAQGTYDYLVISKLDSEIPNNVTYLNAYNNESIQYYTRGKQNAWYNAEYEITDNNKHFIEILYLKNASTNTEPDKGFVAFKNNEIIGAENIYDISLYQLKVEGKFTDDSTIEDWYVCNGSSSKKVDISEFVDPETKEFDVVLDNFNPSYLFYKNQTIEKINSINIPIDKTSLSNMFRDCSCLNYINLENLKTQNVTNMSNMFYGCSGLESLNLDNLNTKNVTNMSNMFYGCSGLESLNLDNWNTKNVTNMSNMFYGCSGLESLNLDNLNTKNLTNISYMFYGCSGLESLNLDNLNTKNLTNISYMFYGCSSLESLNLSHFDTQNVTDMSRMFWLCENLKTLNLENWNTEKVKNMTHMFSNCSSLESLNLDNWNTKNVTDMGHMFYGCSSLESLDLSHFDTQNVTDMSNILGKLNLDLLNLENWNIQNISSINGILVDAQVVTLNLNNWDFENVMEITHAFNLKTLKNVIGTNRNIKVFILLDNSPLTNESAMVFINGLSSEIETTQRITFSTTTYDTLTEEQIAIATSKGWSVVRG